MLLFSPKAWRPRTVDRLPAEVTSCVFLSPVLRLGVGKGRGRGGHQEGAVGEQTIECIAEKKWCQGKETQPFI